MPFKVCSVHLMFIIIGYVLFLGSAVGSGVYLVLRRFRWTSKLEDLRLAVLSTRDTLDRAYLAAGFLFITIAFAVGFYQARNIWSTAWSWDPKQISSAFVWLYYGGTNLASWRLPRGERKAVVIALMSLLGIVLLGLNYAAQFIFPSLHRF